MTTLLDAMKKISLQFDSFHSSIHKHMSVAKVGRDQFLQWLDAVFTHEEKERALFGRVTGTCDWIMDTSEFRDWLG